jgi:holo-ACP synthase/triphosphoribosyl-dephospho-CoA synthase
LDQRGEKLNRGAPRSCIVCGKPGRECAAGRLHPVEDIVAVTNNIISDHFIAIDSKCLGKIAAESLVREVETTPKPGLVDLRNNGSHSDMSISTFKESARVLEPYFVECVKLGISSKSENPDAAFNMLRKLGIDAEAAMYDATKGVNTHKGLIYSLGTLLCATGRLWTVERPIDDINSILREVEMLVSESTVRDLKHASGATAGERLFITKGLSGIRGEVASGFP